MSTGGFEQAEWSPCTLIKAFSIGRESTDEIQAIFQAYTRATYFLLNWIPGRGP